MPKPKEAVLDDVGPDTEIVAENEDEFLKQFAMKNEDFFEDDEPNNEEDGDDDEGSDADTGDDDGDAGDDVDDDDDDSGDSVADDGGDEEDFIPEGAPEDPDDGDIWLDEEGNKEYTFKDGKWVDSDDGNGNDEGDQENTGEGEGESDYLDDVIPGLKGKDFGLLSEESQAAIATFYDQSKKSKKDYDKIAEVYDVLSKDPIAQHRIKLIQDGRNRDPYQVPEIDDSVLDKMLDTQDRAAAVKLFKKEVQRVGATMADNVRIEIDNENRARKTNEDGERIILEAANMHPDCKHKISNLKNADDPDHADHETYEKFTKQVIDYCAKRGWRYDRISEFEPAELYALVANRNKWPVVQNAEERDRELVKTATKNALKHFLRDRGKDFARGMRQIGSNEDRFADHRVVRKNGVDLIKLAQDDDYHDRVLNMKPGNEKWLDKVMELRHEGEQILERRAEKRKKKRTG